MNKPFYIFLFMILFCCEAKTQTNLVPNGSFEEYYICPNNQDQLNFAKGWYRPTVGSSDYFNSCDFSNYVSVPDNIFGYKLPFNGNAYVGFCPFYLNQDYSEYLSCKLISPMQKDSTYLISFYLALAGKSAYTINSIGMYFDNDSVFDNDLNGYALSSYTPQIVSNSFITDTLQWTKVSGEYKSTGDEQFIVIGNFKSSLVTDTMRSYGMLGFGAYYFIDSVSVFKSHEIKLIKDIPNVFTPNGDGANDAWEVNLAGNVNCVVYNRWGNKIFETSKNMIKWDGRTTSGMECLGGIYYYVIQTETENYKGFIQLLR